MTMLEVVDKTPGGRLVEPRLRRDARHPVNFFPDLSRDFTSEKPFRPLTISTSDLRQKWWLEPELNQRHKDFQSSALPTELSSQTRR